jgi:hypothetical protein
MKMRDYLTDLVAMLALLALLYGFLIFGSLIEQGAL